MSPEPGWYPDPFDPARDRWWNGVAWTEDTQAGPQTPDPYEQARQTAAPEDGDYVAYLEDERPALPQYDDLAALEDQSLTSTTTVLAEDSDSWAYEEAGTRRTPRWKLFAAVGLVLTLLVGAGAAAAMFFLNGRGPQPEDILPGNTAFMARVDFDPSLGQKANAVRLLSKFPDSGVSADTENPQDVLIDQSGQTPAFVNDAKAWIGARFAFALIPFGTAYAPAVIASVRDTAALDNFMTQHVPGAFYAVKDGYAVISNSQGAVESILAAEDVLARQEAFQDAKANLGVDPIGLLWADLSQARKIQESTDGLASTLGGVGNPFGSSIPSGPWSSRTDIAGSAMLGLTAEPDALRTVLVSRGVTISETPSLNLSTSSDGLSALPSSALGALTIANLSGIVRDGLSWASSAQPEVYEQYQSFLAEASISEETLYQALGQQLSVVALPGAGSEDAPAVVVAVKNSSLSADEMTSVIERIASGLVGSQTSPEVAVEVIGEYTYIIPETSAEAFTSAKSQPSLGENEDFQSAFPTGSTGFLSGYVSSEGLSRLASTNQDSGVENLRAVGFTVSVEDGSPGNSRTEFVFAFR